MDRYASDHQINHQAISRWKLRRNRQRWSSWQDLLAGSGLKASEAPSVSTDQPDYSPGELATITAKGFRPGERISFSIADDPRDPGDDGEADVYQPFAVRDGSQADLDGDVNGQVVTTWRVPSENNGTGNGVPDALNATLILVATGMGRDKILGTIDDNRVKKVFTDAEGSTNKVYQHWADSDGQWNNNILSATKSDYFEGEVVPHVFVYKASQAQPLVAGQQYSFDIFYNYYQANTNSGGFDRITTYSISRSPGANDATVPYVAPTISPFGDVGRGNGMDGEFYTVDAKIVGITDVSYVGTGTLDGRVTVTFQYTGITTGNGIAEIYYGLRIASPGSVADQGRGPTRGANAWTGGSLQTTVDVGGAGATSIQLSPSAVIVGSISGVKYNDINGDGSRNLDGTDNISGNADDEVGLPGWTIFLDSDNDGILDSSETFAITSPDGSYSFSVTPDSDKSDPDNDPYYVREVAQEGWKQTTLNPQGIVISSADPTETNVDFGNQRIQQNPALTIDKFLANANDSVVDTAGETIEYTITVANTGNVDLSNVVVDDTFAGGASYVSGDTDRDSKLDVNETWTYSADYVVTQDDLNNGGTLTNTAGVTTDQTTRQTGTASSTVQQNPALTIDKVTNYKGNTGDGLTNLLPGDPVSWTYTVTNSGNIALKNVVVKDDAGTPAVNADDFAPSYLNGDTGSPLLDPGESWVYTASGIVQSIDYRNIATVTASGSGDASASDSSSYLPGKDFARTTPTGTTCDQYLSGTAADLSLVEYGVKSGSVNQSNPGVFYYYTGRSGVIGAGSAGGSVTVFIDQSNTYLDPSWNFKLAPNNVAVYRARQGESGCSKVTSGITYNTGVDKGDISLSFNADPGYYYVVSAKYDTNSIKGLPVQASPQNVQYSFATDVYLAGAVGPDGVDEADAGGVLLRYKNGASSQGVANKKLLFDGDILVGGGRLRGARLDAVARAALDFWADQGIGRADLQRLRRADVVIGDLAGATLAETRGSKIVVDADAAGHGWSASLKPPAADRVDLYSVVVHEYGHLLGFDHDVMPGQLGIGERVLPFDGYSPPSTLGSASSPSVC